MADLKELQDIASQIRRDVIRMTHSAGCGHPGGALGCADFFSALYFDIMDHNSDFKMDGVGEDIFFLSNGHICPGWYSALARSGYFENSELATFRQIDSRLQGHPATEEQLEGIRVASGSLGQGLSVALGAALTKKLNGDDHLVYTLHGDGEIQEGQIWEALIFGAHHKIDNIIATIDNNDKQIDGPVHEVMSLGDVSQKIKSFGWEVLSMNGNDMQDVVQTVSKAKSMTGQGKPICIVMNTLMGYGVDFMEDDHKWHGVAPNDEQAEKALTQLEETLGDY
ncbi:MAG: transketolase [Chitinophagales bacterium]|nr:transketolase [Chitinophagales bacterium]